MKTLNRVMLVMAATLALASCGGGSDDTGAAGGAGGTGTGGTSSGGTGGSGTGTSSGGLTLNAALGVDLADRLIGKETSYASGSILVEKAGKDVNDAVVTLNGTTLPLATMMGMPMDGFYSADDAALSSPISAGGTLKVSATQGGSTASMDLPCPKEVTITSPTDNTAVTPGQTLTVTWSGSLDTGALPAGSADMGTLADMLKSHLSFHAYDATAKSVGSLVMNKTGEGAISPSATSATITIPSTDATGLVLELNVQGKMVTGTNSGVCNLSRRVLLTVSK